ncbi:MAG: hypothetical protein NUW01_19430 [Gemmatimonadaceae bacterium]|nr:hypothetical protein [Gemmatimonadaceae bacterium]
MSDREIEADTQAAADQTAQDARCLAQYIWAFWDEINRENDAAEVSRQMSEEMRITLTYQFHHSMTGTEEDEEEDE